MLPALEVDSKPLLSPRKRWRRAFATLYSTRVLKQIVSQNQSEVLHSLIDIPKEFSGVTPSMLAKLVQEKNVEQLDQLGGVNGFISALETDAEKGIRGGVEDIGRRRNAFGSNTFQGPSMKIIHILLETFKDPIMIVLLLCATFTIGIGMRKHGLHGCLDGGIILAAVFLVIAVSSLSKYWLQRQLYKLSKSNDHSMNATVIRNGKRHSISISDVVVGDVLCLGVGDRVPADGLYIDGHSLLVDESHIKNDNNPVEVQCSNNPFLHYGSKVIKGDARMLVIAVGKNTSWGQTSMSSTSWGSNERMPLQIKIHRLTSIIAAIGLAVAVLVLTVLVIRYFLGSLHDNDGSIRFASRKTSLNKAWKSMIGLLVSPVAIASAAIPEGLLLAVAITIAYTTQRMADDNVLVRNLSACEVISSATVICTNKRGILKMNELKVSQCWIGSTYIGEDGVSSIAPEVLDLLHEGIALKDAYVPLAYPLEITNQEIQHAIEVWGEQKMKVDLAQIYAKISSSEHQGLFMIQRAGNPIRVHKKGDPDFILPMCSQYYEKNGISKDISDDERANLEKIIEDMRLNGFHCVAFACKDLPAEQHIDDDGNFHPKLKEDCWTLLAFVGLKPTCQPEAQQAVLDCQNAGVTIKMITEDDIHTARASAIECGIIKQNEGMNSEEVMEAADLRNCSTEERLEKVGKIRVLARASTIDKLDMVKCLKQKGHIVAVTGNSEGGARELREADLRLSLGIQGADDAVEQRSDTNVLILDDNFASVARVIRWSRVMYNSIQIFTQFQLTASIASLMVDFVTTISTSEPPTINIVAAISAGEVPFATLQMLWVKLMMGTLAALALTADKHAEKLMQQPPVDHNKPFITNIMWRNIVGQATYQIIVLLTIQFTGESTFNLSSKEKDTMIFNIFVLCQLFSIINAKNYERSIFSGLHKNRLFWGIVVIIILLQVMMIEMLKRFANTERLSWEQWKACIGIAFLSWPIGWLIKCTPLPRIAQTFDYLPFYQLSP
nr:putative calcium-transporting ATPase 13, plasma membrane-type [Ipomoea batatas]